jgi:LmbE family N-acetylglucosaminyl deacetylase
MRKAFAAALLLLAGALAVSIASPAAQSPAPRVASGSALAPPSSGGLVLLDSLLKKLTTHRRLMIVGAHPDDENTALLTLVSRRLGGEAAYLSLSRGEGGQNLIGEDLGVGLGLIRSQELVAARQLDGGRQFFTRAYDFGYTRSLDETLTRWPKEALLEDAVRITRRFRPQVIHSVFSGTARDGHGQHQASGLVAAEVFRLAGDAAFLPQLSEEGLAPWRPRALYRSDFSSEESDRRVRLPTGEVDPVTGRSYHQIAMASRSLHRSQDMGRLQDPGPNQIAVVWVAGAGGNGSDDVFAGIDTRLRALAEELPEPARGKAQARLDRAQALAEEARRGLSPAGLEASVRPIEALLAELQAARAAFPADAADRALMDEKIAVAQQALAAAAGVALDATAAREAVVAGESVEIVVRVWNSGTRSITVEDVALESFEGWPVNGKAEPGEVAAGGLREWKSNAAPPAGAPPTVPYFLRRPLQGDLYDWNGVSPEVRGEPFQPAPLTAIVRARIGATPVTISRDVVYRYRDQAIGEIRRPLRTVPLLEVHVTPDLLVWPIGRRTHPFEVAVTSNSASPVSGQLEITSPAGWSGSAASPIQLEKAGDSRVSDVTLTAPERTRPGRLALEVAARRNAVERYALGIRLLDYPHIPPTPMPREASLVIRAAEIRLPPLRRVGYVHGAADRVPEYLRSIGVPVEVLSERDLEAGDLSRFDVIVIGSRAYETEPALVRANGRLLDYARAGGLLIVQYQQYAFVEGGFAPYKLEIGRPHDRITDETSQVKVLQPDHPIVRTPNRIVEEDWAGWVQERGLYFAKSWDPAYTPLLALTDPGTPEQRGGLLLARVGRGHYVYTGLAFFRQLPAGVPGAYRLFANLLAWKANAR